MKRITCILALFFCLAVSIFAGERTAASVLRVIDGDTMVVWDGATETTVRLLGVDTPESRRNAKAKKDAAEWGVTVETIALAGKKARSFVASIAPPGIEVGIAADGRDRYGRTLAYIYLPDGRCLNDLLLRNGVALAPERYHHDRWDEFAVIEREAREKGRGFWKTLWKHL